MRLAVVDRNGMGGLALVSEDGKTYRWADDVLGRRDTSLTVHQILADRELRTRLCEARPGAPSYELEPARLLAPVKPRRIVGVGLNYRSHAAEVGRSPGGEPVIFLKDIGSLNAPFGAIKAPAASPTLDYEAELAVILGAGLSDAGPDEASAAVGGYAVANDLTLRALARPPTLTLAKGCPGSCPIGPWVTTADAVADLGGLEIRSSVNGEARQAGPASEMIFGVGEILSYISRFMHLEVGDVVLTGSPSGSGASYDPPRWLKAGDVVRAEISGLGAIETKVVA